MRVGCAELLQNLRLCRLAADQRGVRGADDPAARANRANTGFGPREERRPGWAGRTSWRMPRRRVCPNLHLRDLPQHLGKPSQQVPELKLFLCIFWPVININGAVRHCELVGFFLNFLLSGLIFPTPKVVVKCEGDICPFWNASCRRIVVSVLFTVVSTKCLAQFLTHNGVLDKEQIRLNLRI